MSVAPENQQRPAAARRALRPPPMLIFGSRWLQLPLYAGLIVAQAIYAVLFLKELWHLFVHARSAIGIAYVDRITNGTMAIARDAPDHA
jgi:hypothetical protein